MKNLSKHCSKVEKVCREIRVHLKIDKSNQPAALINQDYIFKYAKSKKLNPFLIWEILT